MVKQIAITFFHSAESTNKGNLLYCLLLLLVQSKNFTHKYLKYLH